MAITAQEDLLRYVKERNVKTIQIWFTDILGYLKGFSFTASELEGALADGMGIDGSSIKGFSLIHESDLVALPDPSTFQILPWSPSDAPVGRMFCDILNPDRSPFEGDPRFILKRVLRKIAGKGWRAYLGPELEFFICKNNLAPEPIDGVGYFDPRPADLGEQIRDAMVDHLQRAGIEVEYHHHEVAPGQHEIDMRYDEALAMADKTLTYKAVVKEVARLKGCHASFMPKPFFGINGSGMHVHQSLFSGNKNQFFDASDPFYLSQTARSYLAGLLRHVKEFTAVTNQWVNSYKRLVPGFEAPVYIAWARRNRSAMARIPLYKPGNENATRIELRSPDPSCNAYLAFALMLSAGLKGIKEQYTPPEPVEKDIYEMSAYERRRQNIETLPGSLNEALQELEKSELAKEVLGEHVFSNFIELKRRECEEYNTHVSKYEIDTFYPLL